ncbi:MAG: leukotoxin LktA family filamentous adhesin, partial [Candidatus Omnitrophica bacterium]|nr:leukotoxin LktA family filamentous adhesin [Candidatus Omnitrophota bacterium]
MMQVMKKLLSCLIIICFSTSQITFADQIIPDGQTQTTLEINQNITDITTASIHGANAFNSFEKFDVYQGNTVNLHLPEGTSVLINLVHGQASHIDGILNSIKNGQIGGNVFFANPYGLVVGQSGILNVGSLTAVTPSKSFMDSFFDASGMPNASAVAALLDNNVPISEDGLISIQGKVNAIGDVRLSGQDVLHGGSITTGVTFQTGAVDFSDLVNVAGLEDGTVLSVQNGEIYITAQNNVADTGILTSDGRDSIDAGDITMKAGNDIEVTGDAAISANGQGAESSGGDIRILAGHDATLGDNATVSAQGGDESGDGGFIELSAKDTLHLAGGHMTASAVHGSDGAILLDPENLDVEADVLRGDNDVFTGVKSGITWDAGKLTLLADQKITIEDDVVVSSRSVSQGPGQSLRDAHIDNVSTGDSGDIELKAPEIELKDGSMVLAHVEAGSNYTAGDVKLTAYDVVGFATPLLHVKNTLASIKLNNALIKGKDVTISATAESSKIFDDASTATEISLEMLEYVNTLAGASFSNASADISLGGNSSIYAHDLDIKAEAKTDAHVKTESTALGVAYGKSTPTATVTIGAGSTIQTQNDLTIHSLANSNLEVSSLTQNLGSRAGSSVDVSLAIGESNITSTAQVANTASLTVGGDLELKAEMTKTQNTSAKGGAYEDGSVGVAVAISDSTSNVNALLEGDVNARGNITVEALSTTEENKTDAKAQVGGGNSIAKIYKASATVLEKLQKKFQDKAPKTDTRSNSKTSLALAASVVWGEHNNNALARIGDPLSNQGISVRSTGQIDVKALITDAMQVKAKTKIDSDKLADVIKGNANLKENSVSAAVVIGDFTNTAKASIEGNADVDAKRSVSVVSETKIPYDLNWDIIPEIWEMLTTDLTDIASLTDMLADGYLVTSWAAAQAKGTKTVTGGTVNDVTYTNNSDAYVASGAQINQANPFKGEYSFDPDGLITTDGGIKFKTPHDLVSGDAVLYSTDGTEIQGLKNGQTYYVQVVDGSTIKLAASTDDLADNKFIALDFAGQSGEEHQFQDLSMAQQVNVTALSELETVNLSGLFDLSGEEPETSGVGGSYLGVDYRNNVTAAVQENAIIDADSLQVKATTTNRIISLAESGGQADDYAIDASFSMLDIDNATTAEIAPGAEITTRDGIVTDTTNTNVLVEAKDHSQIYNLTGGVSRSKNVGVGA